MYTFKVKYCVKNQEVENVQDNFTLLNETLVISILGTTKKLIKLSKIKKKYFKNTHKPVWYDIFFSKWIFLKKYLPLDLDEQQIKESQQPDSTF